MNPCPSSPFSELARSFVAVFTALCGCVAARAGRDHSVIPLTNLLWTRLNRGKHRLVALADKWVAGWRPAPAKARGSRAGGTRAAYARLPYGSAWIYGLLQHEAAAARTGLEAVLGVAETRRFLDDVPAARRILRPICGMLAVVPPVAIAGIPPAPVPRPVKVRLVRVSSMGFREYSDGTVVVPEGIVFENR